MVTRNAGHFSRFKVLEVEAWQARGSSFSSSSPALSSCHGSSRKQELHAAGTMPPGRNPRQGLSCLQEATAAFGLCPKDFVTSRCTMGLPLSDTKPQALTAGRRHDQVA
ncbi:MAG: hypothetical protein JRN59_06665, partial [Nitrososphaerota archaeon]|nr:hypothetical protein [Nitrososphaerota archaeon]